MRHVITRLPFLIFLTIFMAFAGLFCFGISDETIPEVTPTLPVQAISQVAPLPPRFSVELSFPQGAPSLNRTAKLKCNIKISEAPKTDLTLILQLPEGFKCVRGDLKQWKNVSENISRNAGCAIPHNLTYNGSPWFITKGVGLRTYFRVIQIGDWKETDALDLGRAAWVAEVNLEAIIKSVQIGDWEIMYIFGDISILRDYSGRLFVLVSENSAAWSKTPFINYSSLYRNSQNLFPLECVPVLSNAPPLNQTATVTEMITRVPGTDNYVKSLKVSLILSEGFSLISGEPTLVVDVPNDYLDLQWVIKATKLGRQYIRDEIQFYSKPITVTVEGHTYLIRSKPFATKGDTISVDIGENSSKMPSGQQIPIYRSK